MNILRAGKQQQAFWRSQLHFQKVWTKESTDYQRLMNMERGHAAGWIAGVAWAKRNLRKGMHAKVPHTKKNSRTIKLYFKTGKYIPSVY